MERDLKNINEYRIKGRKFFALKLVAFFLLGIVNLQAHDYGFMFIAGGTGESSLTANTWHTVGSDADTDFSPGYVSNFNASVTNKLAVGVAGDYHIAFSVSFSGDNAATWEAGISVITPGTPDPVTFLPSYIFSRYDGGNKDAGVISGSFDTSLSVNDTLILMVRPSASVNFTPLSAQLVAVRALDVGDAPLGSMHIYNNSTATSLNNSAYLPVNPSADAFSAGDVNEMVDVSYLNDSLKILSGGTYFVNFHVSYIGDGNSGEHLIGVVQNGANTGNDPDSILVQRKTSGDDIGVVSATGIMKIPTGYGIRIEAKTGSASVNAITVKYINLLVVKLNGTSTAPPFASMNISGTGAPRTVDILNTSDWANVDSFAAGNMSGGWSFDADTLEPVADYTPSIAGIYFAKYAISFKSPAATGDEDILFGLFIGRDAVEHRELTTLRRLSGSSDVASIQGVALIDISSVDSTVFLRAKNITAANDIVITSALFNLYRMSLTTHDGSLPVELLYFSGLSKNEQVNLAWETGSEIENLGFILERRHSGSDQWQLLDSYLSDPALTGQGSVTSNTSYKYIDEDVVLGTRYDYRLSDVDYTNNITRHSFIQVLVRADNEPQQPEQIVLHNAFPNPFNPSTTLSFTIQKDSELVLAIYDALGHEIKQLVDGSFSPGKYSYQWDGTDDDGSLVNTGIYFAHLQSGSFSKVTKLIYLK